MADYDDFLQRLTEFYADFGRSDMAWRQPQADGSFDPYKILVSEIMLQQTQVSRVTPKYQAFMQKFRSVQALAAAELGEVLTAWSGLGYNRRAKFLWQAAAHVTKELSGAFPDDLAGLQKLPGVGINTAGAIMAYAYNQPVVYLETNIRTVLIHEFFADADKVADTVLRERLGHVVATNPLPPREFYWAMMDYGTFLKKNVGNLSRNAASYTRQSTFQGSLRQLRGQVIKLLAERPHELAEITIEISDDRLPKVLAALEAESLIRRSGNRYHL